LAPPAIFVTNAATLGSTSNFESGGHDANPKASKKGRRRDRLANLFSRAVSPTTDSSTLVENTASSAVSSSASDAGRNDSNKTGNLSACAEAVVAGNFLKETLGSASQYDPVLIAPALSASSPTLSTEVVAGSESAGYEHNSLSTHLAPLATSRTGSENKPSATMKLGLDSSDKVPTSSEKARERAILALRAFDTALRALKGVSAAFPPLQFAIEGLIGCIDVFKVSSSILCF
jgi:hypothetical protein